MALEQLRSIAAPDQGDEGGGVRAARLPRWTRQEILVLIQGKRVAENRVRRGRSGGGLAFGPGQVEPKWASVSSYCKRHGVNRGPVQCRKRWSNLAGDYKKIKEWETHIKDDTESFWVMRNDLRRDKKLPGFFDREVYDILDGGEQPSSGTPTVLALAPPFSEPLFDSGADKVGLFSDADGDGSPTATLPAPHFLLSLPGIIPEKQNGSDEDEPPTRGDTEETTHCHSEEKRQKRKWSPVQEGGGEEDNNNNNNSDNRKLIKVLEDNGRLLSSHLEAHNMNSELEREQRKEHVNSLVQVLNKIADAFVRIADKL
jgi:hypothetical protein